MSPDPDVGTNRLERSDRRLRIAVFSGATATIQNTPPLVTSNQARVRYGLPLLAGAPFDVLRPQRLAAPTTVYIEALSAHPLERDAADLYAPPDGYIDRNGQFHRARQSADDVPVYEAVLRPEDGLYLLPYMARQADGSAWDGDCASAGAEADRTRQSFLPDGARLIEEIDRFGLDGASGTNGLLSREASFTFFRAAPSAGYIHGLPAEDRTDEGEGDVQPEVRGEDFYYYSPSHLAHGPAMPTLARLTNCVQEALDSGDYDGAIWLEGSPALEETAYWLNLVIDTTVPICGNASQRRHGALSNDGDRNIVDSVAYVKSRVWADSSGRDVIGAVVVQEQQAFTAREVQKSDARPGGYVVTGGHGGVVASIGSAGTAKDVRLTFRPVKRHTHRSKVNVRCLPEAVDGVFLDGNRPVPGAVQVKNATGQLLPAAIPKVTVCKYTRYGMDDYSDDPDQEVEILARIQRNLVKFPLAGFVLEGNSPFGRCDESTTAALRRAVFTGMPVVCVGRGNAEGVTLRMPGSAFLGGSNLTTTKARMLLMACLLRFGAAPPAQDPTRPTAEERARTDAYVAQLQEVFDTH